ncbi:MAG: hypothetical protein FJ293_15420 [Planctomycetes bacterium]|nr:hypothetical protein [Planctomycetota bacterium]
MLARWLAVGIAMAGSAPDWRVAAAAPVAGEQFAFESTVEQRFSVDVRVRGVVLRTIEQSVVDAATWTVALATGDAGALLATVDYGPCPTRVVARGAVQEGNGPCDRRRFAVAAAAAPDDAPGGEDGSVRLLAEPGSEASAPPTEYAIPRPVAPRLAERVLRDVREAWRGGVLAGHLSALTLRAGEAFELPVELGAALLGDPLFGATIELVRVTPTDRRDEAGRAAVAFATEVRATLAAAPKDGPAMATTYRLSGELLIGATDGRLLAASLEGPLESTASSAAGEEPGRAVELAGTGMLRWTYRARPIAR